MRGPTQNQSSDNSGEVGTLFRVTAREMTHEQTFGNQWQLFRKQQVVGSSPTTGSRIPHYNALPVERRKGVVHEVRSLVRSSVETSATHELSGG